MGKARRFYVRKVCNMAFNRTPEKQYALALETVIEDRYVIKQVLGLNGLSITYKAYDTFRDQTIVLREIYPAAIVTRNFDDKLRVECVRPSDEHMYHEMLQKCIQKAKKMIRLYPLEGISNIIRYVEANHTVYLIMDYIDGISLPVFFEKKRASRMELDKTVELLQPVLESLKKIHAAGLFHGRISPDSIILDSKRHAHLVGFGDPMEEVALEVFGENTAREFAFAPVEQYVPGGVQGTTTDVYAVGAVIYLCVTGVWPAAFYERVGNVTGENDPLKSPWELGVPIMEFQSDAIMKALAVYTFDRFQSIQEFIDALELDEFKEGPSAVYTTRLPAKFAAKQRWIRIAQLAAALLVIVLVTSVVSKTGKALRASEENKFYENLVGRSLYDKCDILANLPEKEWARYGNDYTASVTENDISVRYYDLNSKRFADFSELSKVVGNYKYVCLDFRRDHHVILTYLTPGKKESYECDLTKYGSYYRIEHIVMENGSETVHEKLEVNPAQPDGAAGQ